MKVGELIKELEKYPKEMVVTSLDKKGVYRDIQVTTDRDAIDKYIEWVVIECEDISKKG